MTAATTATTAASQPQVKACENSAARRLNCLRESASAPASTSSNTASDTAMPLGRHSTRLTSASPRPAHHEASSRRNMPRATNSSASPAMLPRKCAASTTGSGMWRVSSSVASSVAGVTPDTSRTTPTTQVNADNNSGDKLAAAFTTGVAAPRCHSAPASIATASARGSRK